jgi:hypothetical protein
MIVWRGWGFLAFVIPLGLGTLVEQAGKAMLDDGAWYFQSGFCVSLPIVWFLGRWLNNKPEKILIDPGSGEQVVLRGGHSLFWIPLQYWAFVGLAMMVVAWLRGGSL